MKSKAMSLQFEWRQRSAALHAGTLHTARFTPHRDSSHNLAVDGMLSPPSEDDEPLLGGRAPDSADDEDTLVTRVRRVFSCRRMLRLGEVAGSLGDLGTFLPDLVALSNNSLGAYPAPAAFVFFSGFWSVYAGVAYDLPMPIQPMHTVVAVSLTEGLTYPETIASGVLLGAMFLILGLTG
jgi:hypothetical protein